MRVIDCIQGSEEWENVRKGRLTASEFAKVLGTTDHHRIRLVEDQPDGGFGRAKAQAEVFEKLQEEDPDRLGLLCSTLNASGIKGLIDKGLAVKFVDQSGCTLRTSAAEKHIDLLLVQKSYHPSELGEFIGNDATDRGHELEPLSRMEFEADMGLDIVERGFIMRDDLEYVGGSPDGMVSDGGIFETKSPLPQTHKGYLRKNRLPTEYKAQVHGLMALADAPHAWFQSYCPGLPTFRTQVLRDGYTTNLLKCLGEFEALMIHQKEHAYTHYGN